MVLLDKLDFFKSGLQSPYIETVFINKLPLYRDGLYIIVVLIEVVFEISLTEMKMGGCFCM